MATYYEKLRYYRRVYFSVEDGIIGNFIFNNITNESNTANIMNISMGGLEFNLSKNGNNKIKKGDHLVLTDIEGTIPSDFINIEIEIKWILDHKFLKEIRFGCEFLNMTEANKKQVFHLVKSWFLEPAKYDARAYS